MKKALALLVILLLPACATNPPVRSETYTVSETLRVPYETAWQKTMQVLTSQGLPVESSNERVGVISIGETTVRLNEQQADCGSYHGISYLKDYRTATYVKLFIDLEKISDSVTSIRINSTLKAYFNTGIGADPTYLPCYSSGELEKRLLASIRK